MISLRSKRLTSKLYLKFFMEVKTMLRISLQFFAHKKGVGSTKNGRDSESKRLGVKKADGQGVIAGNIIVPTIHCSLSSTEQLSSSASQRAESRLAFTLLSNCSKIAHKPSERAAFLFRQNI